MNVIFFFFFFICILIVTEGAPQGLHAFSSNIRHVA